MSARTIAGIHPVREALRSSPEKVQKLIVARGRGDERLQELLELAARHRIPVNREARERLDQRSAHHQGVLAEFSGVQWVDLDELVAGAPEPGLLLVLDRIEDPRNFGAIARTAEGAGAHGIVVAKRGQAPASAAAMAASAGALSECRLARVTNVTDAIERLKKAGFWIFGLDPKAPRLWYEADYAVPAAIVLGSEGRGMRRRVRDSCDVLVSLPQLGRTESLNVSVASGVVLYEVVRQRREVKDR